jgi:hypothetical protein
MASGRSSLSSIPTRSASVRASSSVSPNARPTSYGARRTSLTSDPERVRPPSPVGERGPSFPQGGVSYQASASIAPCWPTLARAGNSQPHRPPTLAGTSLPHPSVQVRTSCVIAHVEAGEHASRAMSAPPHHKKEAGSAVRCGAPTKRVSTRPQAEPHF